MQKAKKSAISRICRCTLCDIIISKVDASKHRCVTNAGQASSEPETYSIAGNVLFAELIAAKSNEKYACVYMNQFTMNLLGISIGDSVILNDSVCISCLPSKSTNFFAVTISETTIRKFRLIANGGRMIKVAPCSPPKIELESATFLVSWLSRNSANTPGASKLTNATSSSSAAKVDPLFVSVCQAQLENQYVSLVESDLHSEMPWGIEVEFFGNRAVLHTLSMREVCGSIRRVGESTYRRLVQQTAEQRNEDGKAMEADAETSVSSKFAELAIENNDAPSLNSTPIPRRGNSTNENPHSVSVSLPNATDKKQIASVERSSKRQTKPRDNDSSVDSGLNASAAALDASGSEVRLDSRFEDVSHDYQVQRTAAPDLRRKSIGKSSSMLVNRAFGFVTSRTRILVEPNIQSPHSPAAFDSSANEKTNSEPNDILLRAFGTYGSTLKTLIQFALRLSSSSSASITEPKWDFEVPRPRGVIVYGPSGTGKSTLVRTLLDHLGVRRFTISPTEIWSHLYGQAESKLNSIIDEAMNFEPSVVLIDDLEVLCPRRVGTSTTGELERRVTATLASCCDRLASASAGQSACSRVLLLATSRRIDAIEPLLRRAGRFDTEFEICVPLATERRAILDALVRTSFHQPTSTISTQRVESEMLVNPDDLDWLAEQTHGFVGADLLALLREASLEMAKFEAKTLQRVHLEHARERVRPSALKEVAVEVPRVSWSDVGGMDELKARLRECIEWPLKHSAAFERMGIRPARGVLLFGPPGCSKTLIAKAIASQSRLSFLAIRGPELFSKFVGESERAVRELFRRARQSAPAIIFFDEIDALAVERSKSDSSSGVGDRVLAQMLTEMDGIEQLTGVLVIAATNRPDTIDRALLRPGRLDLLIYVRLPDEPTRSQILAVHTRSMPLGSVDLNDVAKRTAGYSGAEVAAVCRAAAMCALRERIDLPSVEARHFDAALYEVLPRTPASLLDIYEKFERSSRLQ